MSLWCRQYSVSWCDCVSQTVGTSESCHETERLENDETCGKKGLWMEFRGEKKIWLLVCQTRTWLVRIYLAVCQINTEPVWVYFSVCQMCTRLVWIYFAVSNEYMACFSIFCCMWPSGENRMGTLRMRQLGIVCLFCLGLGMPQFQNQERSSGTGEMVPGKL